MECLINQEINNSIRVNRKQESKISKFEHHWIGFSPGSLCFAPKPLQSSQSGFKFKGNPKSEVVNELEYMNL